MKDTKNNPKITVFGVGEAGCKLVDTIAKSDIGNEVKTVAVDDELYSDSNNSDIKISLRDKNGPRGLGGPKAPQESREDSLNVYDEILDALKK